MVVMVVVMVVVVVVAVVLLLAVVETLLVNLKVSIYLAKQQMGQQKHWTCWGLGVLASVEALLPENRKGRGAELGEREGERERLYTRGAARQISSGIKKKREDIHSLQAGNPQKKAAAVKDQIKEETGRVWGRVGVRGCLPGVLLTGCDI